MKKSFIPLIVTLFASIQSFAAPHIDFTGEIGVNARVWNLPSGEQGNSEFAVDTFFLGIGAELQESNYFQLTLQSDEKDISLREAYLDITSVFKSMSALRIGLLPQPWLKSYYEIWDYRFVDRNAWGLMEKWNYYAFSDYGLSYMSEFSQGRGEWALTIVNGKEEKDRGPHKDFGLFVRWNDFSRWSLSMNYSRGSYDRYADDSDLKERAQFLAVQTFEKWRWGLELFYGQDSKYAYADIDIADGVDVAGADGGLVTGLGASLFATVSTGEKAETFVRVDYLDAAQGEDGKALQTYMLGLGYRLSEDLRLASMVDYVQYGDGYYPGARDSSKLTFAAQVLF